MTLTKKYKNLKEQTRSIFNNSYIRAVDSLHPLKGKLSKDGYYIYNNKNESYFKSKQLNKLKQKIEESELIFNKLKKLNKHGASLNFNDHLLFTEDVMEIINSEILKDIILYLGKGVKLDHTYLSLFYNGNNKNKVQASGYFHHDSVGHRIKVFVPLSPKGTLDNPTVYLSGSNKVEWRTYTNNIIKDTSRIPNSIFESYRNQIKEIAIYNKEILVFDTNGIHKGSYKTMNDMRPIIQFEFSANKSFLRGQVGPGSFYLTEKSYKILSSLNLVRERNIIKSNNLIFHKGSKRRKGEELLSKYL
tara:strand:- start:2286 stop:3194 length:909 start_codon:yes stop_codon:yes gene_type:complete